MRRGRTPPREARRNPDADSDHWSCPPQGSELVMTESETSARLARRDARRRRHRLAHGPDRAAHRDAHRLPRRGRSHRGRATRGGSHAPRRQRWRARWRRARRAARSAPPSAPPRRLSPDVSPPEHEDTMPNPRPHAVGSHHGYRSCDPHLQDHRLRQPLARRPRRHRRQRRPRPCAAQASGPRPGAAPTRPTCARVSSAPAPSLTSAASCSPRMS